MIKTGSSIYYWPKPNVVFVAMPKAANTAIWHTLRDKFGADGMQKLSKDQLRELRAKRRPFTFTVVRNPYDRCVSMWSDKLARRTGATARILKQHTNMRIGMGFQEFIAALVSHSRRKRMWNQHFQTQRDVLSGLEIDVILAFEELQEDWVRHIHHRFNIPYLNPENQSQRSPWVDYYDQITLTRVNQIYSGDFSIQGNNYVRIVNSTTLLPESGDVRDTSRKLSAIFRPS